MDTESHRDRIIFDLDGVLLDSESDLDWLEEAICAALEDLGVKPTRENIEKLYPDRLKEFHRTVRFFPHSPEKVWEIRDKYYTEKKLSMIEKGKMRPFPDVDLIRRLRDNYTLGIISNSPQVVVEKFVQRYGYTDTFTACVGRGSGINDLSRIKPSPYLYQRFVEQIGDGTSWYIGDSELDRKFAVNAGMRFILLRRDQTNPRDKKGFQDKPGNKTEFKGEMMFDNMQRLIDFFL
jgi:phosphoglycolate phosphatase